MPVLIVFRSVSTPLLADREALLEDGRLILNALADCSALDKEQAQVRQEMEVVAGLVESCIKENAARAMDQTEYTARYDALAARYEKLQARHDGLQKKRERRQIQADEFSGFLFAIYSLDALPLKFDPALWTATVDHVTVHADGRLVFRFSNGVEVAEAL